MHGDLLTLCTLCTLAPSWGPPMTPQEEVASWVGRLRSDGGRQPWLAWRTTRNPHDVLTPAHRAALRDNGVTLYLWHNEEDWTVTLTQAPEGQQAHVKEVSVVARLRFLSWYVVTGERTDVVDNERLRRDWWLAHQDVGVAVRKADRRDGVAALLALEGAVRGRGCVRGVVGVDTLYDEAEEVLGRGFGEG